MVQEHVGTFRDSQLLLTPGQTDGSRVTVLEYGKMGGRRLIKTFCWRARDLQGCMATSNG